MEKNQNNNNKKKSFFANFIKENQNQNKKEYFFKNLKEYDLNKTPVFLTFITFIFIINFIIFILITQFKNGNSGFGKELLDGVIGFGANNRFFVFEKLQIHRIIIFPFVEAFNFSNQNMWGTLIPSIFSFLFILWTFWIVGYYLNVIVGSKKTAIIWIGSIFLIGLSQVALTKNAKVFYYGTEYLTLISFGALLGCFITIDSKEKQLKEAIKRVFSRVVFSVCIFALIKFWRFDTFNGLEVNSQYSEYGTYIFVFYLLSFLCGFLLFIIANYKKTNNNIDNIALYASIISLTTIFIASLSFIVIFSVEEKIILQKETIDFFDKFPNLNLKEIF